MRGYAMSMAVSEWWNSKDDKPYQVSPPLGMHTYFTGPDYYWMWPFKNKVNAELQMWLDRIHRNELHEYIPIAEEIKPIFREKKDVD